MVSSPPIAIVMGSQSDWPTMRFAAETLEALRLDYEARIVSAHRTPLRMVDFATTAREDGFQVIIAGATGPGNDCVDDHTAGAGRARGKQGPARAG